MYTIYCEIFLVISEYDIEHKEFRTLQMDIVYKAHMKIHKYKKRHTCVQQRKKWNSGGALFQYKVLCRAIWERDNE